jgi:PKD repeat protein
VGGTGPVAPVASFTGTPVSGNAPLNVVFTDASTGSPTSWSWTFGDGGTSTAQNPSHTYTAGGTYTVALTVSNAAGSNTQTRTGYITVTTGSAPVANFTGTPTTGTAPLAVHIHQHLDRLADERGVGRSVTAAPPPRRARATRMRRPAPTRCR